MSSKNLINDPKIKNEAMIAWLGVKTRDDVALWHRTYTPWWTEKEIEKLLEIYDKQLEMDEEKNRLIISEFDKLLMLHKS